MRHFAKPTGLERLSLEARIIYTGFSLFMLIGFVSSAWLYHDDALGIAPSSAARYYLGEDAAGHDERPPADGPRLEIAPKKVQADLRFAKPPRQMMETFHFHLFTMPVCLLIIAHLFMMSRHSTRHKAWVIALATVSTLIHLVLPLLIRFASEHFAVLMFPSALLLGLLWTYMTMWPVYEMWRTVDTAEGARQI